MSALAPTAHGGSSAALAPRPTAVRPRRPVWALLLRNREAVIGLIVMVVLGLLALFADAVAPHDPYAIAVGGRLEPPSLRFPFGTDQLGRDLLSRIIYGARISLYVA